MKTTGEGLREAIYRANLPLPSAEEIEQMEMEADYEHCGECLASVPYGLTGGEFFTETGCIYCSGK